MLFGVPVTPNPLDPGEPPGRFLPSSPAARRGLALAAVVASVAIAVFAPESEGVLRSSARFHDFLHVPGLGLVAVLLLFAYPVPANAGGAERARRLAVVFGVTLAAGVLIELLQALVGRSLSMGDVIRDAGGAAAVVLAAASLAPGARTAVRWTLRAAAVAAVAALALPTVQAVLEERAAEREFPLLAGFSRAEELERFEWIDAAPSWPGAAGGTNGAAVTLRPGPYPGFALVYFPRDWRGYSHLVFSATNPSPAPMPIVIRVDDMRHNKLYTDRFNARYVLVPGRNEIRVPLAAVEVAPRGRRMDMSRIRQVIVFCPGVREPRQLVLESLRLERDTEAGAGNVVGGGRWAVCSGR